VNQPPVDLGDDLEDGETLFRDSADRVRRPPDNYLQLDMHQPLSEVLPKVDAYLKATPASLLDGTTRKFPLP